MIYKIDSIVNLIRLDHMCQILTMHKFAVMNLQIMMKILLRPTKGLTTTTPKTSQKKYLSPHLVRDLYPSKTHLLVNISIIF